MSEKQKGFDVEEMTTRLKDKMKRNMIVTGLIGAFVLGGGGYWIAWAMWGATMGLGGLILASVMAAIPFFGARPFWNWLEVKQIALIQKIAADNPIQTQWALWNKEDVRIKAAEDAVADWNTGIHQYEAEVNAGINNMTAESYADRKAEVAMMREDLELQRSEISLWKVEQTRWERLITALETDWNLGLKRDSLNSKMAGIQRKEFTDRIRNDASLTAVRESVARRRAQIEQSLYNSRTKAAISGVTMHQITMSPTETLEIPVTQKEQVKQ